MRAMGVDEKLRIAILLPEFRDIRFTATWVLDAMEIRYSALKDTDLRLIMGKGKRSALLTRRQILF